MAHVIVLAAEIYAAIGALVAAWFLLVAIDRIDPAARDALAFRPLLIPGLVLLWPLVLLRYRGGPPLRRATCAVRTGASGSCCARHCRCC